MILANKSLSQKNIHQNRTILVVEDEHDLAEMLKFHLERAGFRVLVASDGLVAVQRATENPLDLVLLDVMLPELSGTEVASRIRTNPKTASLPIIMLTAKSDEVDVLVGLTVGADDYITKPFSLKVVLARVEAVLRRSAAAQSGSSLLHLGPISVCNDTHEVTVAGELIRLTLTEFRILAALAAAQGRVLSRHILMSKAMGPGVTVTERTIDVHVTAIRKKLGEHGNLIRTVRGVGYRATPEPELSEA